MSRMRADVAVAGAGSYGTALAMAAASKGLQVRLYARSPERAAVMQQCRCNPFYLKDLPFPDTLTVTSDFAEAFTDAELALLAVPSHSFVQSVRQVQPFLRPGQGRLWAAKGLDLTTGRFLYVSAAELLRPGTPLDAIRGPTFARELAAGMPTAIAVAGTQPEFTQQVCETLHTPSFRIYQSSDFVALQLGGAVKNVIAIGAGMSDGLGYGANARTALITRGLVEITRLGAALGAQERSFMGLSGLGDLILTCTDNQSRNRRFGLMLGQGQQADAALKAIGQAVEGYAMTAVVYRLAQRLNVEMPICSEIYAVLYEGKAGREAARSLLGRAPAAE